MFYFYIILVFLVARSAAEYDCSKPPNVQDSPPCCKETNHAKEIDAKCHSQFPKDALCEIECIFNETGAIRNGQLQKQDILLEVILEYYKSNSEAVAIVTKAIPKCLKSLTANEAKVLNVHRDILFKCSPTAMAIASCVETNLFVECPASMRTESAKCDQAREFAKFCWMY